MTSITHVLPSQASLLELATGRLWRLAADCCYRYKLTPTRSCIARDVQAAARVGGQIDGSWSQARTVRFGDAPAAAKPPRAAAAAVAAAAAPAAPTGLLAFGKKTGGSNRTNGSLWAKARCCPHPPTPNARFLRG